MFGSLDDPWFKMTSVDVSGNKIENRHSSSTLSSSMSATELENGWSAANRGGEYTVKDIEMCATHPPGNVTTNEQLF